MKTKKFVEKEKNKVVQVSLRCENTTLQTHVAHRFKGKTVKAGMRIELVGDERVWVVEWCSDTPVDKNSLHTVWDNNI